MFKLFPNNDEFELWIALGAVLMGLMLIIVGYIIT